MQERRILIAEDDPSMGNLLRDALEAESYEVTLVGNGQDALDKFSEEPFPVVITDIEMPLMDGYELIIHLNETEQAPTVFVTTANNDTQFIIDVMKRGVYDYIIKPLDIGELVIKVQRAFETHALKRMQRIAEKEREIRLEHQLEWLQWQAKMEGKDGTVDKSLFHNMHVSFSQGIGFGALITLLQIVVNSATQHGDGYLIPKDMMELVKKNAQVAERAINVFSEIEWIMSNQLPMDRISCHALHAILEEERVKASKYAPLNGNTIMLSDPKPAFAQKFVQVSDRYLRRVLYELYINALKFSEKNSSVYILLDIHEGNASVSVINQPVKDEEGRRGIPMEYEYLVFEPFFRMTKIVRENYDTFDYGLGLTMTDKIVEKLSGKITGRNITDHSDIAKGPVNKVEFNLALPLAQG